MLHHRHLAQSNICFRCLANVETTLHCLRDCPDAARIWDAIGFRNGEFYSQMNLDLWLNNNVKGSGAQLFVAALWWNWRARNIVCVGKENISLYKIVLEVHKLVDIIHSCFPGSIQTNDSMRWISWHPSRQEGYVLNVDGSCLGTSGRTGFGGLIRRSDGSWIIGFSGYLGLKDNTFAELMAIYHGLKIARDLGFSSILCYSDSQTVLDLILKGHSIYHCYAVVITNIQDMLKLNWDITLSHSLREGNFSADWLAKLGSANDTKIKIWESPPEALKSILLSDALKSILLSDALRVLHPRA
ncbi:unnamed protein product [Trifolium pratense]|uniref:Uncharacterized protein n=1 Tax=Trifolium pratense TaxID=57577 RepID=A0ACB0JT53_TRIPR|nr:unnamed protein product [Trifolium pratense]